MIGKTVSQYRIIEKLGAGGMGEVYRAEDTKLRREVALKFLPLDVSHDQEANQRFIQEARAASKFDHPNICTVYEINETDDGRVYIAMALQEGETLKERIARGPLAPEEALDVTHQILAALKKAHAAGVVHRDIKPANVVITPDGIAKILDFGLAKMQSTHLTRTGTSMGTVAYMSPEQARGEEVDARTDLWAVGVLLYEMLTGQHPFQGDYEQAVVYAILNEECEPISKYRDDLPKELEKIITCALSKNADSRYQSAEAMQLEVESVKANLTTPPQETDNGASVLSRRTRTYVGVAAVLLLALVAVFFFRQPETEDSERYRSIAVLPFADMSPNKDQEYFCDGMTEEILTKLAKLGDLKVIARTSIMRYKNTDKSITQIADELDVDTILEGSIRKDRDDIRVTAQLINPEDESHIWAENYDRKFAGVFQLQEDISEAIAKALQVQLTSSKEENLSSPQPKDNEAYEQVLKGAYHISNVYFRTGDERDFETALGYFDRAREIDSTYASVYIEKAWAYHARWAVNGFSDIESLQQCRDFAEKGLALAPNSSKAHAMLATAFVTTPDDIARSYPHFREAFRLNPNEWLAHHSASFFMRAHAMIEEAVRFRRKARELDPLALGSNVILVDFLLECNKLEEAEILLEEFKNKYSGDPHYTRFIALRGAFIAVARRDVASAKRLLAEAERLDESELGEREIKAYMLALQGRKDEALETYEGVGVYAMLGMNDEAFALLQEQIENKHGLRQTQFALLKYYPPYQPLRGDPRFEAILEQERQKYERFREKYGDLVEVLKP